MQTIVGSLLAYGKVVTFAVVRASGGYRVKETKVKVATKYGKQHYTLANLHCQQKNT